MYGALRCVGSVLSRASDGAKLAVLIYHRVPPQPDLLLPGEPDAAVFTWQMEAVARSFRVVPLAEGIADLRGGRLKPRSLCITFDDGYADNATVALPILRRVGLPATFFVATGSIDGGRMWNDSVIEAVRAAPDGDFDLRDLGLGVHALRVASTRRHAIDRLIELLKYRPPNERDALCEGIVAAANGQIRGDLMMTSEQVRTLAASGMEVGAHTVSHRLLSKLSDDEARREILESRTRLEQITGRAIRLFAYPNGRPGKDYGRRDVNLVAELGFVGAVSTAWGVGTRASDPLQIPRFTPWDRTPLRFVSRLLHNYTRTGAGRV